jgi:hypothetical protein
MPTDPVTPSVLALIVVLPAVNAVTIADVSLIDATAGFELAHLIGKPFSVAPEESMTVTVACVRCPTRNCDDVRVTSRTLTFSGLVVMASGWHAITARTIRDLITRQRDALSALLIDSCIYDALSKEKEQPRSKRKDNIAPLDWPDNPSAY